MSRRRAVHYVYVHHYGVLYKFERDVINRMLREYVLEDEGWDFSDATETIGEVIDLNTVDREKAIHMLLEGY